MKLTHGKSLRVSFVRSQQERSREILTRLRADERHHGLMRNLLAHIQEALMQASVSL